MSPRTALVNLVRKALYSSGLLGLYHRIRNRRTLTVLMFHRVLPAESPAFKRAEREFTMTTAGFSRCMDFVQQHYNPVSLQQIKAAGIGGQPLPPRAVLITFDDGWRDTLLYAYPELKKRGLPAVLFLATEVIQLASKRWWQDALVEVMADPMKASKLADALGTTANAKDFHAITAAVAALNNDDRMALLEKLVDCTDFERQMLTLDDIASIDMSTLAIAAHGHSHAPMTRLLDQSDDLITSHEFVAYLGGDASAMSFPHGDWSAETESNARECGFEWIFSSNAKLNHFGSGNGDRIINRIHVPENQWTCDSCGISNARLGMFLFFRNKSFE